MPSCKQITEIASTSLETPLPKWQRWQFRLHLLICRHCRRYFKQLRFLHRLSATVGDHLTDKALSANARARIAEALQQASEPHGEIHGETDGGKK